MYIQTPSAIFMVKGGILVKVQPLECLVHMIVEQIRTK